MDERRRVVPLFFDMSRAFDSIDLSFVISKCYNLGLRGNVLQWINSFLIGRKLIVSVEGSLSWEYDNDCGVGQGSVIGPLIFILFINDLASHISEGLVINYADDTSIAISGTDPDQLHQSVRIVFSQLKDWCHRTK